VSKKKAAKVQEDVTCNLIPMIDIMFLLLLFFMLGADMGQRELEEVMLPTADSVKEDKDPPTKAAKDARTTVNVYHAYETDVKCAAYKGGNVCIDEAHWLIGVRGKDYTKESIKGLLKQDADLGRRPGEIASERRVMIRADQAALYGFVQKVMNACAEVGIYKVEIAAAQKVVQGQKID
jgi:biopolymer transport protein ExbD